MTSNDIVYDMDLVSQNAPLILNITNYAAMNVTANALLALGAKPIMANAKEEIAEVTKITNSLVINIGTPSTEWAESMLLAGKAALAKGTPIVFDPVGVETTSFRREIAKKIISECRPTIIRGNASEISTLNSHAPVKDAVEPNSDALSALTDAKALATRTGATVIVSGAIDYITDGQQTISLGYGAPIMKRINIMGSTATAICAAFAAVDNHSFNAATAAMAIIGIAGRAAAKEVAGPGNFMAHFVDFLYKMSTHEFAFDVRFRVL